MISVLLPGMLGCGRPVPDPSPWVRTTTPDTGTDTGDLPSVWDDLGRCRVPEAPVPLPDPIPAACNPALPGWVSGPVAGRALARVVAPFADDNLGYSVATTDPNGDGRDALVVGAPRVLRPDSHYYRQSGPENPNPWPRTHLLVGLEGEIRPGLESMIASERNSPDNSIGQSAVSLTARGPILLGDYWGPTPGHIEVMDATVVPPKTTIVAGDALDSCGADVGVADIDGSGTFDIVTACLQSPLGERGTVGGFRQDEGTWIPFFRIEGTIPYSWFGRPSVGAFDLDRDGRSDFAIGEEHIGADLESAVHLISGPREGDCTLDAVGATTVWNGFVPATLVPADVDGDGVGELVVTSQGSPVTGFVPVPLPGRVAVLREWPADDTHVADASWLDFVGESDGTDAFGAAAAVGDFNGDGCADVAVGAPGHNYTPYPIPGRVYVFHGPFTGGTLGATDAEVVFEGAHDDDRFGMPMTVGDFDGIDDLVVSAVYDNTGGDQAGAVYVLAGVAGEPRPSDP